ncbi:LysR family transcriptional regulator (plasmid) [Bosea sp. F3-2]|uniref:LysR family transcriptional regulator n=1 Tax=Bosea sp. F3-2 TaxID=2599640 RepID=UPI0011EE8FC8|nr:LysR family transcriptional regulator [Bosea sp. F3-2]QEL27320.1 LysR family transcriptional regulator [Bosea sp. F3-2]
MITLRQLEALYWIVELGTFERAADKLNTTQSAISKRIHELEASTGLAVFDRSQRGARLTEQGEQILTLGQSMLDLQEKILMLREGGVPPARRIRIGVTELSALTWLPRLVTRLRQDYPTIQIDPDVDLTRNLYERLLENDLDLIVIPEVFAFPDVTAVRIGEVRNSWMSRPDRAPAAKTLNLAALAEYPILVQGRRSGSGMYINQWLKTQGISFPRILSCDSLTAQLAFAVAGLGIGYFPQDCFLPLVKEGKLALVASDPELPPVPYAAMFRSEKPTVLIPVVADMAREVCDFSRQLQS